VSEQARHAQGAKPVWEVVETWLKAQGGRVAPRTPNTPRLVGTEGDAGLLAER
jgi:sulfur-oxidizing protein SoxB